MAQITEMTYGYPVHLHKKDRVLAFLFTSHPVMKSRHPDNQDTANFVLSGPSNQLGLPANSLGVSVRRVLMAYRYDIGRWLTRGITKIRWYRVSNNYRLFPFDPKAGMTEPVNIHRPKYSTDEFYSQGI
jgi:hypothetical protein